LFARAQLAPIKPEVKFAKTRKLFLCGVSRNSQTGKTVDPPCYDCVVVGYREGKMANKQSIQDVDAALDRWHRKLTTAVNKINDLRDKRKKLIKGYIKRSEPEGIKVMFDRPGVINTADFDDVIPTFGNIPAIE
jgi:hypothetical protein